MPREATEIEVEVVEVDGIAPTTPRDAGGPQATIGGHWQDWQHWRGRVARLDNRWWPLWVLLGIIGLALALTLGLVIGAVILVMRFCARLLRALLR